MKNFFRKLLIPGAILFCGIAIYGIVSFVGADELSGTPTVSDEIISGGNSEIQTTSGGNNEIQSTSVTPNSEDPMLAIPGVLAYDANITPPAGYVKMVDNTANPQHMVFVQKNPTDGGFSYSDMQSYSVPLGCAIPTKALQDLFLGSNHTTTWVIDYTSDLMTDPGNRPDWVSNPISAGGGNYELMTADSSPSSEMSSQYGQYFVAMTNSSARIRLVTLSTGGCVQPINRASIYGAVYAALESSGIHNNLNNVTNDNVTNFPYLTFFPGYGMLEFQTGLDLTDPDTQSFLETLPNNLSMTNGYLDFNPTGNGSGLNIPARLFFYLDIPPFIGTGYAVDYVTARDNNNTILSGINLDGLFANDGIIQCDMGEGYYCEFYVNHFTSFEIKGFDCDNVTDVSTQECNALVDLYTATNGDNWDDSDGWLMSYNVCDRYGVTCEDNHVTNIELEENSLDGNIPGSISGLQYLQGLDIYDNSVTSLPYSIGELSNLTSLEFSDNLLTSLPETIGNLTQLTEIYGYGNHLTTLPDSISNLSSLNTLDVSDNRLSSIDLSGLNSIQYLFFNENLLTTLGDDIINFDLDNLAVDNNCRDISSISTGTIDWLNSYYDNTDRQTITNPVCNDDPDEVAALTDLYYATDGPNSWDTNSNWLDRSVSMCTWYGVDCRGGTTVRWLILKDNYLSGAIPESFGNLTHLNRVNVQYNNITSIPDSIGNLSGINVLVLDHNSLTSIPASISGLVNLGQLSIQNNYIRTLPESIGGLHYLMRFFFNDNYLTTLPDTFTYDNLSNLNSSYFDMANNCIWEGRLTSGVNDFLNSMEIDRGNQEINCPTTNVLNKDGAWENMTNDTYIYDYTNPSTHFTTEGGTLTIRDGDHKQTDFLRFSTDGFTIDVVNGTWDGMLYSPTEFTDPVLGTEELPAASGTNGNTTTERMILFTTKAGASGSSLQASGGLFTISFRVASGTDGEFLKIYRSSDHVTWEANTPDSGCTLTEIQPLGLSQLDKTCTFQTDHLSYFTTVRETTTTNESNPPNQGNPGGTPKDNCPNGDTSPSYYDGKCTVTEPTNITTSKTGSLAGSPFIEEINNAYLYAYTLGITSSPTILGADIEGQLIRSHMAKMMVNYAVKVMGLTPDINKTCSFDDVGNQPSDMQAYITLSCQLGLMGIDMTSFDPDAIVTRAQFGTILSRTLFGDKYNGSTPYYEAHLTALKEAGIMTNITNAEIVNEIRGYVLLMLMRADK